MLDFLKEYKTCPNVSSLPHDIIIEFKDLLVIVLVQFSIDFLASTLSVQSNIITFLLENIVKSIENKKMLSL